MRDDTEGLPSGPSAADLVAAIEGTGLLSASKMRELHERLDASGEGNDGRKLARRLVREGTLTTFQARRLLKGKKRGLVFGRYILLDHIGQGARGQVFKARHSLMDRVVALKVVLPDAHLSKRAVQRFFREMQIVGRLDHPNVVRALDADEQERCPYIVMEYLEGEDLEQVFAHRGALPADDVIDYMTQAARGLAHAHEQGVIHRDIKPTNLFLTRTGVVKVLDLGFGDLVGSAAPTGDGFDTDEGVVVGTTDFMPPELIQGKSVDARSDLFSLGCTMYRLLTGDYAFPGITREDRLLKRIREKPVPITDLKPNLPYALVEVVHRLLATRPEDRFASAADLADALEALRPRSDRSAPKSAVRPVHSEPDAPPDWSLIESALRPDGPETRRPSRPVEQISITPPTTRDISAHRKSLEADGQESGRDVHEKYRHEVVQMNQVRAELRAMDPTADEESEEAVSTWLERLGERIGDYLADPDPTHFLIAGTVILLLLGWALARSVL